MAVTRVCLYTRISTDEENQPTSLHSQRERLEAFCQAQEGWRIVAHQEDRATGTKLDRPGLQAALDLARDGRIDLLLVYRVDRLSRKVRQLAQLAEELDAYQVVLRSATEPFDTGSAAGRMMLQMLAVFAGFEHATIVDRVSAGIERRAKEGRWYAGRLGGRYEYYACSGRQKHGPKACRNERLPRHKLEHAVFEQLASLYRDGDLVAEALAQAEQEAARTRPEIEQRLASIGAEIARAEQALERYHEAFEQGKLSPEPCDERLSRLQARLDDLRAQQAELSLPTPHEAEQGPTPADLAAAADQLEHVLAEGEPQKTKALLRLLIEELRIDGRAQIQLTYRLVTPEVCATSEKWAQQGSNL